MLHEASTYVTGANRELAPAMPLSEGVPGVAGSARRNRSRGEQRLQRRGRAEVAQEHAENVTEEALKGFDVEYTVVTVATEEVKADRGIEIADERDCDHVFTVGRQRSLMGKAVFGDTTQRLVLNFPGFFTVQME